MDPTGNFYNYRTALKGAVHRSQTANSNRERVGLGATLLLILWKHSGMDSVIYLHVHICSCLFCLFRLWFLSSVCWLKTFTSWMKDVPTGCPMAMSTLRLASLLSLPRFAILKTLKTFHLVRFCFLEICGAGTAGWGVHDMETGGVSFRGGSRNPALPPHCSHLQWGW